MQNVSLVTGSRSMLYMKSLPREFLEEKEPERRPVQVNKGGPSRGQGPEKASSQRNKIILMLNKEDLFQYILDSAISSSDLL